MGVLFKFILIFFGGLYLLRLASPFLFKWLVSSLVKKANNQAQQGKAQNVKKEQSPSDTMGEYIDYEELDE